MILRIIFRHSGAIFDPAVLGRGEKGLFSGKHRKDREKQRPERKKAAAVSGRRSAGRRFLPAGG